MKILDFFLRYKIVIFRTLGVIMLVVGFSIHYWVTPKEVLSENDKAAARVARMEAMAKSTSITSQKKNDSKFLEHMKDTQAKQVQYMTILAMVFGIGFLGYSFIPKKDEDI